MASPSQRAGSVPVGAPDDADDADDTYDADDTDGPSADETVDPGPEAGGEDDPSVVDRLAEKVAPDSAPVVLDRHDDRWAWRRRIRSDPRSHFFYRIGVAVAGLFFVVLAAITGPLPGPGGIPLFLIGLAIWSSEFEWAQRLMHWVRRRLSSTRRWPLWLKVLVIAGIVIGILLGMTLSMAVTGGPWGWLPEPVRDALRTLPWL